MKNLKLLNSCMKTFPCIDNVSLACQLYDGIHELIVVHNLKVSKVDTLNDVVEVLFDINEVLDVTEDRCDVVGLAYFSVEQVVVCALHNGYIIRYNVEASQVIDSNNIFPHGIKAMVLSPDNELLVFVTSDECVHLSQCRLDVLSVSSLGDQQFGQGEFINVGWGKKETQFHGSEGKEAAKQSTLTPQLQQAESGEGERVYSVTWRGDSSLFAVGYPRGSLYMFKVYDREGTLHFTSEMQPGLECHFSWRPSGNLIATTQQYPNKYVVAFFEKNGLKHGEFVLPFKKSDVQIKEICWSSDSEVLCIWYLNVASKKSYLYFYTINNYHWYLKYSANVGDVACVLWDESNTSGWEKLIHVISRNGEYSRYNWVWCVSGSKKKHSHDESLVGVADGKKLLLTSFRKAVVPPPMAEWTVECDSNINHIVFGLGGLNQFALIKDNNTIDLHKVECDYKITPLGKLSLEEHVDMVSKITQWLWISDKIFVGVMCPWNNSTASILIVKFNPQGSMLKDVKVVGVEEEIIGICSYKDGEEILLQTCSGGLLVYRLSSDDIVCSVLPIHFPEPCYQMDISRSESDHFVYGLTFRGRFYINNQQVANNVNSFYVHSDFLLVTTLQHQLLCCPLGGDVGQVFMKGIADSKNHSDHSVFSRKVERGSRIITAVSGDSRVVLQLPRGNIECIQPRALSLKVIGLYLSCRQFYRAFDLMRKQRINLNLFYDYDPKKFIENIDCFIQEINNISWLNLFISDIDNEDVSKTLYQSDNYAREGIENPENGSDKVTKVCQLLRTALESVNKNNKYLLPIITTYVKVNDTPALEKVLLLIKQIQHESESNTKKSEVSADEAIRYLMYMVDVNKLYEIALGLYDFDLVMFVASKSQKDPKEYIPFLDDLKAMDENYRHFTIDDFLKRHESALKHLMKCGAERESQLIPYIRKHNLYRAALQVVDEKDSRFKSIAEAFGKYLMSHKSYREAGVMFTRCGQIQLALAAFTEALDWRTVMFLVRAHDVQQSTISDIYSKLLCNLKAMKLYEDAVDFLMESEKSPNIVDMVQCCLQGRAYRKIISLCTRQTCEMDTVEAHVLEHYAALLALVVQNGEQFLQQKCRLCAVRRRKAAGTGGVEREGQTGLEDDDECDLYSDTSSTMASTATRTTNRTFRSSKNRRKHERKLVSLKEGSKFEDIALVRSLHGIVSGTFSLRRDVGEMNFLLLWLNRDQEMLHLQNSLENILVQMNSSLSEIWTPDLLVMVCPAEDGLTAGDLLDPHLRIPPPVQSVNWKLQPLR